jgi:large subunit ribosomal protein L35
MWSFSLSRAFHTPKRHIPWSFARPSRVTARRIPSQKTLADGCLIKYLGPSGLVSKPVGQPVGFRENAKDITAMGKIKTNKAAAKRFKLTGTGKVKFKRAGLRHNLGNKSRSRKQDLKAKGVLFPGDHAHIYGLLPYGSLGVSR